jgi:hypothetical protein
MSVSAEQIESEICSRLPGVAAKASWGETSLFYNPGKKLPNGVYFCTIKEHDGANDKASALDRPGVFRMAFGLTVKNYEKLFGSRPTRPAKGSPVKTGHDFTRLDVVMPHPIYAWMGWAQVLNPSAETFASVQPLLVDSYDQVVSKFAKTLAGQRRTVR